MTGRHAEHPIDPLLLERWSPRAFDGSAIPPADLMALFEAARWAPSAFNLQPWYFLHAHRDGPDWATFLSLLVPWNQRWAQSASVLIYILSDTLAPGKDGLQPSHSHSFDAGAAWACLALQATRMGYHAHGMSGVQFDRARQILNVPSRWRIEAAAAIGRRGDPMTLDDKLRSREHPSGRKPMAQFIAAGRFPEESVPSDSEEIQ